MANRLRWVLVVWIFSLSLAAAQDRTQLMSEAALQENWTQVVGLAGSGDGLGPVERMLAGHAELALNRNNESLADFLTVISPGELGKWHEWALALREKNPGSAIAFYFEGDALARLHQWPEAITAFDAGLNLAPRHALLLNARGVSFAATWDLDHALVDLTAATNANPRLADAFVSLGSIWAQQQRGATGATRALNKALTLSPDSVVALTLHSGVRLVQGEFSAAQTDVDQALEHGGRLTPAVQARLSDMAELLRNQREKEIQQALASGLNPGMLINRYLGNLQQGQPGSLEKLTTMAQAFPDQRPVILKGIADAANTNPLARSAVSEGLNRMENLERHEVMLAKAAAPAAGLTLGPEYALAIGLSPTSRATLAPVPPSASPRVNFAEPSNSLDAGAKVANVLGDLSPENSRLPFGFGAVSQGLSLGGAIFRDLDVSNGNRNFWASHTFEQLLNTGGWGLGEVSKYLSSSKDRFGSRWQVNAGLADHMSLFDPASDAVAAIASQVGRGSWLPNESERTNWLDAAHGLHVVDFELQFSGAAGETLRKTWWLAASTSTRLGWTAGLSATAALPDLANFASSRMERGFFTSPLSVSEWTSGLDSIAKGTAYGAVFLVTRNANIASGVSTLVGGAAAQGRDWSMPTFLQWQGASVREKILAQYGNYVASQHALGLSARDLPTYLGGGDAVQGWEQISKTTITVEDVNSAYRLAVAPQGSRANPFATARSLSARVGGTWSLPTTPNLQTSLAQNVPTSTVPKNQLFSTAVNPKTTVPPAQMPDMNEMMNAVKDAVRNAVGAGANAPGGFKTGIQMQHWEDGEWPITPWYGLGYAVNAPPEQKLSGVRP